MHGKRARALAWALVVCLLPLSQAAARTNIRLKVEPLYQDDYRRALFQYEGVEKSVSSSGCGAVCVSMAISFLAPETEQTPESLLLLAYEKQLYYGSGLSRRALSQILDAYDLEGEWVGKGPKRLRRELRAGRPMIAYMGPGTFTTTAHYIIISGIDRNNRVWVIDPKSKARSMRWYPLELIFDEAANGKPFLVCWRPEAG